MATEKYEKLKHDVDRVRRESLPIGEKQERVFQVQISKYEYCEGKVERELDDFKIYVYTPEMIVIEKLRAICQQMNEYPRRRYSTARARDFYDIHSTISEAKINISTQNNLELVRNIFEAKAVPLSLMGKIGEYREFHRQDWPSVELTAARGLNSFDFYFDFVVEQANSLKALWEV
jgi:hypothetical protein